MNAHATSTPKGDTAEVNAVMKLLQDRDGPKTTVPYMVSHKGQLGHLLGAAGSVEAGIALLGCYSIDNFLYHILSRNQPQVMIEVLRHV